MKNDVYASFWEHLEDLRTTLIRCLMIIVLTTSFSLFFYGDIFSFLQKPLKELTKIAREEQGTSHVKLSKERFQNLGDTELRYSIKKIAEIQSITLSPKAKQVSFSEYLLPPGEYLDLEYSAEKEGLLILSPLDGMTAALKMALFAGILISSPLTLFLLLRFFAPALRSQERFLVIPFIVLSLIFLFGGLYCGLYLTIPLANKFFYTFNHQIGLNYWTLDAYISYSIFLLFSHGIAFELCLTLLFAVHLGFISSQQMRRARRVVYLLAFILGAILTPPDVLTQVMMASFLIGFYELVLIYAFIRSFFSRSYAFNS